MPHQSHDYKFVSGLQATTQRNGLCVTLEIATRIKMLHSTTVVDAYVHTVRKKCIHFHFCLEERDTICTVNTTDVTQYAAYSGKIQMLFRKIFSIWRIKLHTRKKKFGFDFRIVKRIRYTF